MEFVHIDDKQFRIFFLSDEAGLSRYHFLSNWIQVVQVFLIPSTDTKYWLRQNFKRALKTHFI